VTTLTSTGVRVCTSHAPTNEAAPGPSPTPSQPRTEGPSGAERASDAKTELEKSEVWDRKQGSGRKWSEERIKEAPI
jgi:hypothetical protein